VPVFWGESVSMRERIGLPNVVHGQVKGMSGYHGTCKFSMCHGMQGVYNVNGGSVGPILKRIGRRAACSVSKRLVLNRRNGSCVIASHLECPSHLARM